MILSDGILIKVYRATLYLYWFSKEAQRLIIHTVASEVGIRYVK
jgi:hypothetical protein